MAVDNALLLFIRHLKRWGWRNIAAACAAAVLAGFLLWAVVAAEPSPGGGTGPLAPVAEPAASQVADAAGQVRAEPALVPTPGDFDRASRWAARRDGDVAFAVIGTDDRLRGYRARNTFPSASTVKVMLLVAELRRLAAENQPLDRQTRQLLRAMIRQSDNDAADTIHDRVGDKGMRRVARDFGMTDFSVQGTWGSSRLSASDLARLMRNIPSPSMGRYRRFAMHELENIVPDQSWGAPAVARPDWRVWFKGGWLPESSAGVVVHQGARLRGDSGLLTVAVLTARNPSHEYGVGTVEGIVARLIGH